MQRDRLTESDLMQAYELLRDNTHPEAARISGISERTLRYRRSQAVKRGLIGEFEGQVPKGMEVHKASKSFDKEGNYKGSSIHIGSEKHQGTVPEGMAIKAISRLQDADGNTSVEWVKYDSTKRDHDSVIEQVKSAFGNMASPPCISFKPLDAQTNKNLLAFYPLADLHIGLLAWGEETGEDWDTSIAVNKYQACMERVAAGTENAETAIILSGGDLTHTDGFKPMTPASGNILDADTRWPKMVDAAINLLVFQVELARQKHKKIIVRILPGNHDETTAIAITYALNAWYRNDKAVTVETDPSIFFWYRFGKTMIGATHGHTCKLVDMPLVMANRRADDWGKSMFRFVHGFHIHHKIKLIWEDGGVIGETHQSPCAQDAYHFQKAYLSGRSMQSITYHKDEGEYGRTPRVML